MPRNPKWTRDELILALDLYLRVNPRHTSEMNPAIVALSETLNALPIHLHADEKFRNPNGVYMKLCNFLRFDPSYDGTGLQRGGKQEKAIWDEFAAKPDRLAATAIAIVKGASLVSTPDIACDGDDEALEGGVLERLHRLRERNPKIVKNKKQLVLNTTGHLACEVCSFDFLETYGELGRGFAECHHKKHLADLPSSKVTRLADLAIVCANCHRMLHRAKPWKTVPELRSILELKVGRG